METTYKELLKQEEYFRNQPCGKITFKDDWCECSCGNTPDSQGMHASSQGGSMMEPDKVTWTGYYRCDRCGAVGHPEETS